jgi:hypothetical protein
MRMNKKKVMTATIVGVGIFTFTTLLVEKVIGTEGYVSLLALVSFICFVIVFSDRLKELDFKNMKLRLAKIDEAKEKAEQLEIEKAKEEAEQLKKEIDAKEKAAQRVVSIIVAMAKTPEPSLSTSPSRQEKRTLNTRAMMKRAIRELSPVLGLNFYELIGDIQDKYNGWEKALREAPSKKAYDDSVDALTNFVRSKAGLSIKRKLRDYLSSCHARHSIRVTTVAALVVAILALASLWIAIKR